MKLHPSDLNAGESDPVCFREPHGESSVDPRAQWGVRGPSLGHVQLENKAALCLAALFFVILFIFVQFLVDIIGRCELYLKHGKTDQYNDFLLSVPQISLLESTNCSEVLHIWEDRTLKG